MCQFYIILGDFNAGYDDILLELDWSRLDWSILTPTLHYSSGRSGDLDAILVGR